MPGAIQIKELSVFTLSTSGNTVETPTLPGVRILTGSEKARIVTDKGTGLDVTSETNGLRVRSDKPFFINTTKGEQRVESVLVGPQIASFNYDNVVIVGDGNVSIDGVLLSEILRNK